MNKLIIVLLCAAVLLVGGWTFQPKPQTWEYHVEHHGTISKKKLNELGAEGWELVAATESGGIASTSSFYFKRPKP